VCDREAESADGTLLGKQNKANGESRQLGVLPKKAQRCARERAWKCLKAERSLTPQVPKIQL
jgi:hypothetical protein